MLCKVPRSHWHQQQSQQEQAAWKAWITQVSASWCVDASSGTSITASFVILMHLDSCFTQSCLFSPTRCCFRSQSRTKYIGWRLRSELQRIRFQFFYVITWVCSFNILNRLIPVYVQDGIYHFTECMTRKQHSVEHFSFSDTSPNDTMQRSCIVRFIIYSKASFNWNYTKRTRNVKARYCYESVCTVRTSRGKSTSQGQTFALNPNHGPAAIELSWLPGLQTSYSGSQCFLWTHGFAATAAILETCRRPEKVM